MDWADRRAKNVVNACFEEMEDLDSQSQKTIEYVISEALREIDTRARREAIRDFVEEITFMAVEQDFDRNFLSAIRARANEQGGGRSETA